MHESFSVIVRPHRPDDMSEMLDMWVAAWQAAYPAINFAKRRDWAEMHFAGLERTGSQVRIALLDDEIVGALAVNPQTGYLDQLVVAAASQRRGIAGQLLAEARQISPTRLELHVNQDNARAIAFYRKSGFAVAGEDVNPRSGAPIYRMRWRAIEIRDAVADDAPAACDVLRRSIAELCASDHHNDPAILERWLANKQPDIVASWIAKPSSSVLVAVEGDAIVAVGSVTDKGEIQLNYVSPDARFRGISRALLRALETRAMERRNTECHLISTETAHRFYLSAGYAAVGAPQGKFGTTSGYPMAKRLKTEA